MNTDDLPRPILPDHPHWLTLYDYAWQLAAKNVRSSHGIAHMDTAWDPQRNWQWVWDLSFIGLYARYSNGTLPALGAFDLFYRFQREDGYISMTYDFDSGSEPWPDRINPPLFAWAEWEYYRSTGDASRLSQAATHIESLMTWIDANRRNAPHRRRFATDASGDRGVGSDDPIQFYYFTDCGSSGMDDSPRTPREHAAGKYFDWIDLSSQMVLSFRMLSNIHRCLDDEERAAYWAKRAEDLGAEINAEMWCERVQFYLDRSIPRNFVSCKTAASFWPILAGFCHGDRLDAMVSHLLDEKEFNRPTPVPTLSADDPNYCEDGTYWLGGVWAPTNYMITRGLMMTGRGEIAHDIAIRYLEALSRTYQSFSPATLWEAYSPEFDEPARAAYTNEYCRPNFVGWTALGPIAMLIENILGLDLDAAQRSLTWDIRLTTAHGLEHLRLSENSYIDVRCDARPTTDSPATAHIRSDSAVTVTLRRGQESRSVSLTDGEAVVVDV